jgi:hypothetical protein
MLKFSEVMVGFSQAFATLEVGVRKITLSFFFFFFFFEEFSLLGNLRNYWSGVLDFVCSCPLFLFLFNIKFHTRCNPYAT